MRSEVIENFPTALKEVPIYNQIENCKLDGCKECKGEEE